MLQPIELTSFGFSGDLFQAVFDGTWELVERGWFEMRRSRSDLPLLTDVVERFPRDFSWYKRVKSVAVADGIAAELGGLEGLWEALRSSFLPIPGLKSLAEIEADPLLESYAIFERLRVRAMATEPWLEYLGGLNAISYSRLTTSQMGCLLQNDPLLLEWGGGSGYFAHQFRNLGGIIISTEHPLRLAELGDEFSQDLIGQGVLVPESYGLITSLAPERTLYLSWPHPGAAYPAEVLKRYRDAGGSRLVLQLGNFVGTHARPGSPNPFQIEDPYGNMARFFYEIAHHWRETESLMPSYDPRIDQDVLWTFQVR